MSSMCVELQENFGPGLGLCEDLISLVASLGSV